MIRRRNRLSCIRANQDLENIEMGNAHGGSGYRFEGKAALCAIVVAHSLFMVACVGPGHHLLNEQLQTSGAKPILSVQGYVRPDTAELGRRWQVAAVEMSKQPGFVSAQLSAGVGQSPLWLAESRWESVDALKKAFANPDVVTAELQMPQESFEHVFEDGSEGRMSTGEQYTDNETSIVLINPFTVPSDKLEQAVALWEQGRDFLQQQPGYVSTALHQSLKEDAQYRLVNIARWESMEAFNAANAKMRSAGVLSPVEGVSNSPALYTVIRR